jgi:hypothetical protein
MDRKIGFTVSIEDVKTYGDFKTDKEAEKFLDESDAITGLNGLLDEAYQTWLDNLHIHIEEV